MLTLKKLLYLLSNAERKRAAFLLFMILIMAMLEMVGVVSIMPFMAVLMNTSLIDTNILLKSAFENSIIFGVETKEQFLFLLGVFVFLILFISLAFKFFTVYIQLRFTSSLNYTYPYSQR